ncbi:hypothetical protein [Actinospica robiniae]|uniref:hypothetical protein n=1 Tax=Actinospica robiniae TaxID=304901 RepID=UPI000405F01A|nr:hypothetical protein [Actinospica robiniae]
MTSEDYDIWVLVDSERLHAPDPVLEPIGPTPFAGTGLGPLQIYSLFGPRRLHPPFDDGWMLLGFFRSSGALAQIHRLPASFDDEEARAVQ